MRRPSWTFPALPRKRLSLNHSCRNATASPKYMQALVIDQPPPRRFFAPKPSGRQIIKKIRPSLLTYFRRRFTLHTSQPTTALHPSEGRRTEGGKGPASRWRSATQMFWLLLAAGRCITRWVPSDRTGRPGSLTRCLDELANSVENALPL